ncbi:hypothetical protein [Lysinibacillus xylanilyticus]|uniref:hypothetical protein n=1 Tax=Lysinibacillus xylanilyticus TaxID=582475 RepID=UPI0038229730
MQRRKEGSAIFTTLFEVVSSMEISLIVLGFIIVVGTFEGILEEHLKFMGNKNLEESAVKEDLQSPTFWTVQRGMRLIFKLSRMLVTLVIVTISFVSVLQVLMAVLGGGLGTLNRNYFVLMHSFKIYKAFTKVMSDVVNNTDEAVNDVSKVFSGYNTIISGYENLKLIRTAFTEKEIKNPTNKTDDSTQ